MRSPIYDLSHPGDELNLGILPGSGDDVARESRVDNREAVQLATFIFMNQRRLEKAGEK